MNLKRYLKDQDVEYKLLSREEYEEDRRKMRREPGSQNLSKTVKDPKLDPLDFD